MNARRCRRRAQAGFGGHEHVLTLLLVSLSLAAHMAVATHAQRHGLCRVTLAALALLAVGAVLSVGVTVVARRVYRRGGAGWLEMSRREEWACTLAPAVAAWWAGAALPVLLILGETAARLWPE